jgi:hypothetical protein
MMLKPRIELEVVEEEAEEAIFCVLPIPFFFGCEKL